MDQAGQLGRSPQRPEGSEGLDSGPGPIAVGDDGSVAIVDSWNARIVVFGPDGAARQIDLPGPPPAVAAISVAVAKPADAGTGIRTEFWSASNFTMSTATNTYSNAVGWWQNIMNSLGGCALGPSFNGVFDANTYARTVSWQQNTGWTLIPASSSLTMVSYGCSA